MALPLLTQSRQVLAWDSRYLWQRYGIIAQGPQVRDDIGSLLSIRHGRHFPRHLIAWYDFGGPRQEFVKGLERPDSFQCSKNSRIGVVADTGLVATHAIPKGWGPTVLALLPC